MILLHPPHLHSKLRSSGSCYASGSVRNSRIPAVQEAILRAVGDNPSISWRVVGHALEVSHFIPHT